MSGLFMIRHPENDVIHVIHRIHIIRLAGGQQGTDHRHISRRFVIATEEIVLPAQGDEAYRIFRQIVVPK